MAALSGLGLKGKFSRQGYEATKGLAFDDWDNDGDILLGLQDSMHWALGDWLNLGENRFGEQYAQARAFSAKGESWWRQVRWIAKRVPIENRLDLPWTYHGAVAALEPDKQQAVLKRAISKGWDRELIRAEVDRIRGKEPKSVSALTSSTDAPVENDDDERVSASPVIFESWEEADAVMRKRMEAQREEQQQAKKARRAERERELAEKIVELPDCKYGVILADPEWRFEPWSRETGMDRAADNQYPTSVTEVIAARPVGTIAADDCVLFLWATVPMLPHALTVMAAWGFDYRSHFVWIKGKIGTGYWNRNKHELLLVGVKGTVPAPAMGEQWDSAIEAAVAEHSVKPECFLELIEAYYPSLPKIELNARRAREGWDRWGLEAPAPEDERSEVEAYERELDEVYGEALEAAE